MNTLESMSLAGGPPKSLSLPQKMAVFLGFASLFILVLATFGLEFPNKATWLTLSLSGILAAVFGFSWAAYRKDPKGIKNHGVWFKSISGRGIWGWALGIVLTGFYIVLYFYPEYLGLVRDGPNKGLLSLFDPLSRALSGNPASQWFVYGTLYTLAILVFGIKFLWKYRHNRYQTIRTISVMFFQTAFAFIIPEIMARLNGDLPYYDLKNIWPLNYYNFERYRVTSFIDAGMSDCSCSYSGSFPFL